MGSGRWCSGPGQIDTSPIPECQTAMGSTLSCNAAEISASGRLPSSALQAALPGTLLSITSASHTAASATLPKNVPETAESVLISKPATASSDLLSSSTAHTAALDTLPNSAARTGAPGKHYGAAAPMEKSDASSSSILMVESPTLPSSTFQTVNSDTLTPNLQTANTATNFVHGQAPGAIESAKLAGSLSDVGEVGSTMAAASECDQTQAFGDFPGASEHETQVCVLLSTLSTCAMKTSSNCDL